MDRTEATTLIVVALIEKGAFPYAEDNQRVSAVRTAFESIYHTIKLCEQNRPRAQE